MDDIVNLREYIRYYLKDNKVSLKKARIIISDGTVARVLDKLDSLENIWCIIRAAYKTNDKLNEWTFYYDKKVE